MSMLRPPSWVDLSIAVVLTLVACVGGSLQAVEIQEASKETDSGFSVASQREINPLLGPDQVENQLAADREVNPLYDSRSLRPLNDWQDRLKEKFGLSWAVDYTTVALAATQSIGKDQSAGGMARFYGSWDIVNRGGPNTGTFIWKVEHRHKYTDVPVSGFGLQSGYVGLHEAPFSDQGVRLTNFYWKQRFLKGRGTFVAGFLDATDFVDVYLLASPWTGFMNFAFSTGSAGMDLPNDAALGAGAGYMITDSVYAQAGFTDVNSDPTRPWEGFESTVNNGDFYKWVEVGWTPSQDQIYFDNLHATFWHTDSRAIGTPSGWGVNASYQRFIAEKWLPFVRGGYTHESGSLLQYSASAGVGYQPVPSRGVVALGVNWGKPNETSFGDLDDQLSTELFWRYHLTKQVAVTPSVQYINNPALNPDTNNMWIMGIRARLVF